MRLQFHASCAAILAPSMLGADGLALIAPGPGEAPAGEAVEVELL